MTLPADQVPKSELHLRCVLYPAYNVPTAEGRKVMGFRIPRDMEIEKTVITNLRSIRAARKLSQRQVGERLGVSDRTVHSWESGRTPMRFGVILSLMRIYNVSFATIVGGIKKPVRADAPWPVLAAAAQTAAPVEVNHDECFPDSDRMCPECSELWAEAQKASWEGVGQRKLSAASTGNR